MHQSSQRDEERVSSVNKGCTGHLSFCVCGLGLVYERQNESILTEWAFQEARKALIEPQTPVEEEVNQETKASENKEDKVSAEDGKTESGEMEREYMLLWLLFLVL